jgi:hypothetical protein
MESKESESNDSNGSYASINDSITFVLLKLERPIERIIIIIIIIIIN